MSFGLGVHGRIRTSERRARGGRPAAVLPAGGVGRHRMVDLGSNVLIEYHCSVETSKPTTRVTQQDFLREAMQRLGMTRDQFAARLGASRRRLDNWLLPGDSSGFRELDPVVWTFVREILEREEQPRRGQR
jgi:hypothetical protein